MTIVQRNSIISHLAVEGLNFLNTGKVSLAKMCFSLIAGMADDSRYVPSETMLNQVNIKTKTIQS